LFNCQILHNGVMAYQVAHDSSSPEHGVRVADNTNRTLSLPKGVAAMGVDEWNSQEDLAQLSTILKAACRAESVTEALTEVRSLMSLGHELWAYAYLRELSVRNVDVYYGMLLEDPAPLLKVAYTPTVGEACQKFGLLPFRRRGCYVSIVDQGNVKAVLEEYANEQLPRNQDGTFDCQCIVFSDGARILGLGDLGAWGMGIPLGKLDLYTVCGGFNPHKTMPVILDVGISGSDGNTAKLDIQNHNMYTGLKQDRVKHKSRAGTMVNSVYYGADSFIGEFMRGARELFGESCLLQFEDFNTNDAMPLLAEYRERFLTYNDDIQGTASVAVAALLGAVKLQKPACQSPLKELHSMNILFYGAGAANLGGASLVIGEGGVPSSNVFVTNSRGLLWKDSDGKDGNFKNDEQKALAKIGRPEYLQDLVSIIRNTRPDILIGAAGCTPGAFTQDVIEAMVAVQDSKSPGGSLRPVVFALSNPMTQAEVTAKDAYIFSEGKAIFGSGTKFGAELVNGKLREPGQVNNFFIFPGVSFAAISCKATCIPERFFMVAAEAVAMCLDEKDIEEDSVLPNPCRIREVGVRVAIAVVLEAQASGLAQVTLGKDDLSVRVALEEQMWSPWQDVQRKMRADG